MRWFVVQYEIPDRTQVPHDFEDDLRAAVECADAKDLKIGSGMQWPLMAFSLRIQADDEHDACKRGDELVRSVYGGTLALGAIGVIPWMAEG